GIARSHLKQPPIPLLRRRIVAARLEQARRAEQRVGIVWLELDCPLVTDQGFVIALQYLQRVAEVVDSFGVSRRERDGLSVHRFGVIQLLLRKECVAEIVEVVRLGWIELDRT